MALVLPRCCSLGTLPFLTQSHGGHVLRGQNPLPSHITPKLTTSELYHVLQRREAGYTAPSSPCGPGVLSTLEGLRNSVVYATAGVWQVIIPLSPENWALTLHSEYGFGGASITHRAWEAAWVSYGAGAIQWMVKGCSEFCLGSTEYHIPLPCLCTVLQVILRRNNTCSCSNTV